MTRLQGKLKLYNKSLIIFYITLIGFDVIGFLTTKSLVILFLATTISCLISIIYMLYNLKLEFKLPNKENMKNVLKYGVPTSLERLLSRIFILIYGIIASYLGTDKYSIHTICYSVCLSLEIITNAYQATLMIKVPIKESYEQQYETVMKIKKKCFPYIIFYSFGVFGLYPYETYKTLCITRRKTTNIVSRFNNWSTC